MERYMIFAFYCYYPNGGMNDYVGSVQFIGDILPFLTKRKDRDVSTMRGHVFDRQTNTIIYNLKPTCDDDNNFFWEMIGHQCRKN